MPGFVAVPNDGLRACRTPADRLAFLWLVEQADLVRWGPFEASTSDLVRAAGDLPTRGWVSGFLRRLEAVGVLVIEDAGKGPSARVVRVVSPIHPAIHLRERSNLPVEPNEPTSDTPCDTPTRTLPLVDPDSDLQTTEDSRPSEAQQVWDRYRELQAARGVTRGKKPCKGWGVGERTKEHGVEAMCRMLTWAHESAHDRAVFLRDSDNLEQTLFRRGNCATYVRMSQQPARRNGAPTLVGGLPVDDDPIPALPPDDLGPCEWVQDLGGRTWDEVQALSWWPLYADHVEALEVRAGSVRLRAGSSYYREAITDAMALPGWEPTIVRRGAMEDA